MKFFIICWLSILLSVVYAKQHTCILDYEFNPVPNPKDKFLREMRIHTFIEKKWKKEKNKYDKSMVLQAVRDAKKSSNKPDERVLDIVVRNKNNYFCCDPYNGGVLAYWNEQKGVAITCVDAYSSPFFVGRTKINGPEDYLFPLVRTPFLHWRTKLPYFRVTEAELRSLETQTGTQLTDDERDWLCAFAEILNENFHYFYGSKLYDVSYFKSFGWINYFMGRLVPTRVLLQTDSDRVIYNRNQEYVSTYLQLLSVLQPAEQKSVVYKYAMLPDDPKIRNAVLDDTEMKLLLTLPKRTERAVERLVNNLKEGRVHDKVLSGEFRKLLDFIMESECRGDILVHYMPPESVVADEMAALVDAKEQDFLSEVQRKLSRMQTIYGHKCGIGKILGRPVYDIDKALSSRKTGAIQASGFDCLAAKMGCLPAVMNLMEGRRVSMMMYVMPGQRFCHGYYQTNFKKFQVGYINDLLYMNNFILKHLFPSRGIKTVEKENKTAFARAAYSLTLQYQVALLELADKGGSTDNMNDGKNMSLSEYRRSVDLQKAMKKFTKNNRNKASLKLFPVRNAAAAKGRFPASWDAAEH